MTKTFKLTHIVSDWYREKFNSGYSLDVSTGVLTVCDKWVKRRLRCLPVKLTVTISTDPSPAKHTHKVKFQIPQWGSYRYKEGAEWLHMYDDAEDIVVLFAEFGSGPLNEVVLYVTLTPGKEMVK